MSNLKLSKGDFYMSSTLSVPQLKEGLQHYDETGNYDLLLKTANQLLLRDPNNAEFILHKLKAMEGLGIITSDIKLLQHYVNMRSTDVTAFLLLYKAYVEQGNTAEALLALAYALSIEPSNEQCLQLFRNLLDEVDPKYKQIKVNIMTTNRIGHLACEVEPLLREQQGQSDCLYLFINGEGGVANKYLYDLIKGSADVIESSFWFRLYVSRPMLIDNFFFAEYPYDVNSSLRGITPEEVNQKGYRNLMQIYQEFPQCINIPERDMSLAWQLLATHGITPEDKIVCLHVRDSDYLTKKAPGQSFSHHDYRDADISTYQAAVEALIEKGYTVIRIGAGSNQALPLKDDKYFDFCLNRHAQHGDFLEVMLISVCEFFIATTSGPMSIAAIFDTPTITVNSVPFHPPYFKHSRFIPKRLFQGDNEVSLLDISAGKTLSTTNNKPLLFTFHNQDLLDHGYHYLDNNESDIKAAVLEFSAQIKDRVLIGQLSALQTKYKESLPDNFLYKACTSVITDSFIKDYPQLFQTSE